MKDNQLGPEGAVAAALYRRVSSKRHLTTGASTDVHPPPPSPSVPASTELEGYGGHRTVSCYANYFFTGSQHGFTSEPPSVSFVGFPLVDGTR